MTLSPESTKSKAGLVLTGGGARAAYQVGVLKAVRELLPQPEKNPFPILCGTSAGAINAATLAVFADDFSTAVDRLLSVWENFHVHHVYRSDPIGIGRVGARWLAAMTLLSRTSPEALLDNSPLADMLEHSLEYGRIQENIDNGALYAVSITCSGYTSGQSVSFYQGGPDTQAWESTQRVGAAMPIRAEHLMASSALPFIFPAVKINREYFGDGSMRQIAPVSPALHLGADRVLVVATAKQDASTEPPRMRSSLYPSVAQIAGHALNSIFLDSLNADIELLQRINRAISLIPPEKIRESGLPLRQIKVLVISPSQPIERMVVKHVHELPWTVRFLLRGIGAMNRNGSNLASYLLFEAGYCKALIELGYQDTMARGEELLEFLSLRP